MATKLVQVSHQQTLPTSPHKTQDNTQHYLEKSEANRLNNNMNDTSKKQSSPPKAAAAGGVDGKDDDSNSNAVELTLNELNKINSCEDSITVPAANLTRGKATSPAAVSSQGAKENDEDSNGNSKVINPDLEALSELVPSLKTGEIKEPANNGKDTTNNNRANISAKSSPNHNGPGGVDDDGDDVANRGLRLLDSMVAVKGHKLGTDFHEDETLRKMAAANDSISEEDYETSSSSEGQGGADIDAHTNAEVKIDEIVNEDVDTSDSGSTVARTHSSGGGQEQQLGDLENGIRKGDLDKDNSDDDDSQGVNAHTTAAKSPYREIPEPLYNSPSPYHKHASGGSNNVVSPSNDNKKVHSNTSSPPPRQLPSTPATPQTDSPNSYSQQRSTRPSGDFQPQSSSASLSTATHTAASIMSHEVRIPTMSLPNFRPATGCTNASDYIVRCFVARLRAGITVVKHGRSRWCKSRLRVLHVHSDGRSLSWKPAQGEPASSKRAPKFDLSTCVEVRHAWTPDPLNPMFTGTPILRQKCETANAFKSFALIFPKRTVDITAVTADQCKVLMEGFSALCFRLQVALGEVGKTSNGNEDGTPKGDKNDDDSDDSSEDEDSKPRAAVE